MKEKAAMQFPLKLKNYFFTHQEVIANPEFSENSEAGNDVDYDIDVESVNISKNEYGVNIKVNVGAEKTPNAPYFFTISAFGFFETSKEHKDLDENELKELIEFTGTQVLIGAIRERLADMTARGPWSVCYLDLFR